MPQTPRRSSTQKPPRTDAPPHWVRPFVAVFLAAFFVCGVLGIEAWPLTGWRLFSRLREPRQTVWQVAVVDGAGRETPFPWAELPAGFHAHVHLLKSFSHLPGERRDAVCRAWAGALLAARERRRDGSLPPPCVAGLRVYQETWDLSRRTPNGRADAAGRTRVLRYAWTPSAPVVSATAATTSATSHAAAAAR